MYLSRGCLVSPGRFIGSISIFRVEIVLTFMKRKAARTFADRIIALTAMVLCAVIFYTMRNEHHQSLNAVAATETRLVGAAAAAEGRLAAAVAGSELSMSRRLDDVIQRIDALKPVALAPAPAAEVTELLPFNGIDPAAYKTEVACPARTERTMVMVPAGQSNASNAAGAVTRSAFGARIVNFHKGRCYIAEDPLLGSDGDSGSAWVALANRLIAVGTYDQVVIAPEGAGGTYMVRWAAGGDLYKLFRQQLQELADSHLAPTDILWVHGEAERDPGSAFQKDNGRPYRQAIEDLLLASQLPNEPPPRFFVGLNSSCPNQFAKQPFAAPIRAAQLAVVANDRNAYLGANIDAIDDYADRFSVCHLTASGLDKYVADWMQKILAARSQTAAR
jgi:hypothetical protein